MNGRITFLVLCLAVIGVGCVTALTPDRPQPAAFAAAFTPLSTPTIIPASATPDYTATPNTRATAAAQELQIAQTNLEAARLNNEAAQLAAQIMQRTAMVEDYTATAAPTAIPLTATAQAVADALLANQQALDAQEQRLKVAAMTATIEAPTQMVLIKKAEQIAAMEPFWQWFLYIAAALTVYTILATGSYVARARTKPAQYEENEKPYTPPPQPTNNQVRPMVIMTGEPHAPGETTYSGSMPATDALMKRCARLVAGDNLPYNVLEKEGFRRADIDSLRDFLIERRYAIMTKKQECILLVAGEYFLKRYKDAVTTPPPEGLQSIPEL